MRFAFDGVARVGGGAPIFARAAAFTAEAGLNGFGLGGLEGIGEYRAEPFASYQQTELSRGELWSLAADTNPASSLPRAGWRSGSGTGWAEDGYQYEYPSGWATAPTSMVVST